MRSAEVLGNAEAVFMEGQIEEGIALEAKSAEGESLVDGHFFDEDLFGRGGRLILSSEVGEESFELTVAFEAKPWDRRLREDAALPSSVFRVEGPTCGWRAGGR